MCMTIFNFFTARKLRDEINIFAGMFEHALFSYIVVAILVLQILIISFGGVVFECYNVYPNYGLTIA